MTQRTPFRSVAPWIALLTAPTTLTDRLMQPLEAAGFAAIAGLTKALPVEQASSLSGSAWRRLAPMHRRHARADMQLARAMPELQETARAGILDRMWDNLGRTTAEAFHLDEILKDPARIALDEAFFAMIERIKVDGGVLVTLHLGNWELCAPLAARHGVEIAGVYQRIRNPRVEAAVVQIRRDYYRAGLFAKSNETAREIMRVGRRRGVVGLLGDLRDFRGESVPFFGLPAPSNAFPALLARQFALPIYIVSLMRTGGVRFRAQIVELPLLDTADKQEDVRLMTAAIQRQFESWIRATPDQWMWGHRRWG